MLNISFKSRSYLFAGVLAVSALPLIIGGIQLATLGGSLYYVLAGLALLVATAGYFRRQRFGILVLVCLLLATVIWATIEVRLDFWPLLPRVAYVAILTAVGLLFGPGLGVSKTASYAATSALLLFLLWLLGLSFVPHGTSVSADKALPPASSLLATPNTDWRNFGRTLAGTRYAPSDQIRPDNVSKLKVAWTFRTGRNLLGDQVGDDENTPLQVGDTVYLCTATNVVIALNADTGEERWRFDPAASSPLWQRCRGVSYFVPPGDSSAIGNACGARIVLGTIDARLMEIGAATGRLCKDFGVDGTVDLKQGMGTVDPGFYFETSAPTVVRDLIIVGGWVWDNVKIGEPSGVVRAFNARSGALIWAWDLGNPNLTGLPPPGDTYTLGTPNMWSAPAVDEALGLVYLPLGNATPDFWGGKRRPFDDQYSSSIVALDISSGKERWRFQTVHHDVWDYDIAPQPALYDIPDGKGGTVPALVQATKRGQIFVLDRRSGMPIARVEERAVPQGAAPGDALSPTQPYSVDMPSVGTERLTEKGMWGITMYDQLWCRIAFKKLRYDGEFTPPGTIESLSFPSPAGGFNWGGIAIDESTGVMFASDIRVPLQVKLYTQEEADRLSAEMGSGSGSVFQGNRFRFMRQLGTPFSVEVNMFLSPLGVPCNKPPFGTVSAIDLRTQKLLWQIPAGTITDAGPLGLKTHLPMPVGLPVMGGVIATKTGLVFVAATQDYYLRALDARTGSELWKARLPVGSQATPMTYTSAVSGRQYVLVSAGGWRYSPDKGDYVIAYALPE